MTKHPCRRALELYIKLSLILTVTLAVVIRYDEDTEFQDRVTHSSDSYPDERIESVSTPTLTEIHIL